MKSRSSNKAPLKQAIIELSEHNTLPEKKLDQLLSLQASVLNNSQTANRQQWFSSQRFLLTAAIACFFCFTVIGYYHLRTTLNTQIHSIAEEVVTQHIKLKPLDIETSSIDEARKFFTQLDFSPQKPSSFNQANSLGRKNLIGGRYCSIKGVTAAQLRYRYSSGNSNLSINTLYETAYDMKIFGKIPDITKGESPATTILKGLEVTLWVEKGLLMVLVSEPGSQNLLFRADKKKPKSTLH